MAITLYQICEKIKEKYELECISGEKGIFSKVSWIYYMEDISTLDFIRGGEIVITTGMRCKKESKIVELIEQAVHYDASAVIINVGQYVETIPQEAIQLGNEKEIPVFVMPWKMHIVDLTQDICNLILLEKQKEFDLKKIFSSFFYKGEELNKTLLEEHGLFYHSKFCVIKGMQKEGKDNREEFELYLEKYFYGRFERLCEWYVYVCEKENVFVFLQLKVDMKMEEVKSALKGKDVKDEMVWGIGKIKDTFETLQESKMEAEKALLVGKINQQSIVPYDEIGIYQVLLEVKNKKILENIYYEKLGKLDLLPAEEKEMYFDTLRKYIECNGSIQKIAERSYLHRNTVNYRMKKIKEMIPELFENEEEKFLLWLSFYIKDILMLE